MKNKILKLNIYNNKKKKGFVILYTMILSSIILAVTFGIINIAFKETNFSISARSANEAFFAADTGAECALFYDKTSANAFSGSVDSMNCAEQNIILTSAGSNAWYFEVQNLGESGKACARVSLTRDLTNFSTTVVSKGLNNCDAVLGNVVERELKITY